MKIYFEDGKLRPILQEEIKPDYILDAKYGYSYCDSFLHTVAKADYNVTIYTNHIGAVSNRFAWNNELKVPEVYIRNANDEWTRIDELTNRELREAHNIMRMYIAGAFDA